MTCAATAMTTQGEAFFFSSCFLNTQYNPLRNLNLVPKITVYLMISMTILNNKERRDRPNLHLGLGINIRLQMLTDTHNLPIPLPPHDAL